MCLTEHDTYPPLAEIMFLHTPNRSRWSGFFVVYFLLVMKRMPVLKELNYQPPLEASQFSNPILEAWQAPQLSDPWIAPRVNFAAEYQKIRHFYDEHGDTEQSYQEVIEYLTDQVRSIVGEWGFEKPFTFQQLFRGRLSQTEDGNIRVIHMPRFGDWSSKFLDFKELGDIPNQGLAKAYRSILQAQDGQVIGSFSSHKLYEQLGSPGDVLMLFRRLGVDDYEDVQFEARYVFLQKLSAWQRSQLFALFGVNISSQQTDPETLILNPLVITPTDRQSQVKDVLRVLGEDIAGQFAESMGNDTPLSQRTLLGGIDGTLEETMMHFINQRLPWLHAYVHSGNHQGYLQTFRDIFLDCHKAYARWRGWDVDQYVYEVISGQRRLEGLGGIDGGGLGFDDPFSPFGNWKEGDLCMRCRRHNLDHINRCPMCDG